MSCSTAHPKLYSNAVVLLTVVGKFDRLTTRDLKRVKGEIQRVEEMYKNENEQMRDVYFTRMIDDKIEERNAKEAKEQLEKQRTENIELRKMLETQVKQHTELQVKHIELQVKHIELQNKHIELQIKRNAVLKIDVQEPPTKRARV